MERYGEKKLGGLFAFFENFGLGKKPDSKEYDETMIILKIRFETMVIF